MYAMFVVWTRMLYFAKKFFEIVRVLCCRTIPNETKTVNNEIIRECCSYFKFALPSELIGGLNSKTILCYVLVYCIILASRYDMIMYLS